jgi:O-antigen ligase
LSTIGAFVSLQALGISVKDVDTQRVSSGIGDPNEYALFILALIPLCFYKILSSSTLLKKVMFNALLILLSGIFFYTGSRGGLIGFLGLIGVFLFYFTKKYFKELFIFFALISVIFVFTLDEIGERTSNVIHGEELAPVQMRFSFYRAAWKMFLDHPISGVGTHNFINYANQYGAYGRYVTHSTYLEILSGTGILGFIPFLLLLIHSWKKLTIASNSQSNFKDLLICCKASYVSIIISGSFISADTNKIFWFLLALIGSTHMIAGKK